MPPPIRPIVRTFPVPLGTASRAPVLAGLRTFPYATDLHQAQQMVAQQQQQPSARPFSAATKLASAAGHESPYDPPSGWLFGVKPGEKYEREGWERLWVWGYWGPLVLAAVAYAYKPDTSIQTWALEEARRRLEAEGILPDPATAGEPVNSD